MRVNTMPVMTDISKDRRTIHPQDRPAMTNWKEPKRFKSQTLQTSVRMLKFLPVQLEKDIEKYGLFGKWLI